MTEAVGWIAHQLGWRAPHLYPGCTPDFSGYKWRENIM